MRQPDSITTMSHLSIPQQLADIPDAVTAASAVLSAAGKSFDLTHAFDLMHQQEKLEAAVSLACHEGNINAVVRLHVPWSLDQILPDRARLDASLVAVLQFLNLPYNIIGGSGTKFPGSITFDSPASLAPEGYITSITVCCRTQAR